MGRRVESSQDRFCLPERAKERRVAAMRRRFDKALPVSDHHRSFPSLPVIAIVLGVLGALIWQYRIL